jgi:uncharacterized protein YjlB
MPLKDQIKNYARKLTEDAPKRLALSGMIRKRMPITKVFADDGIVPNNPRLPLLLYRNAVRFDKDYDPASVVDALFAANGWGRSWRDSIYDFVHYHSRIHEVLGVARGNAIVECGGIKGRRLKLRAGDVVILPAGTGHRLIESSKNFLVVGAYPSEGTYDECTDTRDRTKTIRTISKVRKPKSDPVYGRLGPLIKEWRR